MGWQDEVAEAARAPRARPEDGRIEIRLAVTRAELEALRAIATRAFEGAMEIHEITAAVRLFDAMEEL